MSQELNISVEMRVIELFNNFAGFLKLMQNPDGYLTLVKSTQKVLDDQKALLGPLAVKANADKYLEDVHAMEHEHRTRHKEAEEIFAAEVAKKRAAVKVEQEKVDALLLATKQSQDEQKMLTARVSEEYTKALKVTSDLENKARDLNARESALNLLAAELSAKTLKLQQLLG